ncbi:MAG: alanine racemase [Sulfuricellaceae bacterium]|nr:alanine racemase [Sulfuricellaceae bacterium]
MRTAASIKSRPLRATLHLSALRHNLAIARQHAPNSRILAVIKANAYGHGMLRAARALETADGFAVLNLSEAIHLRESGFRQFILLLEGIFSADELPELARHQIGCVIHATWQADAILDAGLAPEIPVWLKLNTGMNRLGLQVGDFESVLGRLQNAGARLTLMTHFSRADEPGGTCAQLARFEGMTSALALPRSMANSAALLSAPTTHADWVRPGIMLYGASPLDAPKYLNLLKPAMTLSSEIISIQSIQAGETVGYGDTFIAPCEMRVGTVACGYADGYPRHAPSGTPVLVYPQGAGRGCKADKSATTTLGGQRTRLIGRVSMDMLSVDLTNLPDARIGSPVTLWGQGLPVEEVAQAAGTISYELLCALAARVPVVEDEDG